MDSPGVDSTLDQNGASDANRRTDRSASASSTSSGIHVAPGVPTTQQEASVIESSQQMPPQSFATMPGITAETHPGCFVVFKAKNDLARSFLKSLKDDDIHRGREGPPSYNFAPPIIKSEMNDDDADGPNRRGTYSKQYTLQHPEIEWVHRGQGRYLPTAHSSRRLQSATPSSSQSRAPEGGTGLLKAVELLLSKSVDPNAPHRRRSLNDDGRLPGYRDSQQRPSLRRQVSEAQAISTTDAKSTRQARRSGPLPTTELERRSSRSNIQQNYTEDDEDDMAGDKEATYEKDYVEAHPEMTFYHTGNGWYKRGSRPKRPKQAKQRETEGHAIARRSDGTYDFDGKKTIHVSQLSLYPGIEFHHTGNGWYRPGADLKGHRTSRLGGDHTLAAETEDDEDEDDQSEHFNAGRVKRRNRLSVPTPRASDSISPAADRDQTIYSKEYVLAHPNEEFHHRGNARYMRGPPPDHWASSRRRKSANAVDDFEEDDDESQLFSKAYVKQHPNEMFHHRGQGRYARGPRPVSMATDEDPDEEAIGVEGADGLVDTDWVNAHPGETFHHRGQGRWARGLPPPGASNKTAIRGPGSRDRPDAANLIDDDEADMPPPPTALVLKSEGPDMWPGIHWFYRGGGKWSRMQKHELEEHRSGGRRAQKGRASGGPEAQLECETSAAASFYHYGDEEGFQNGDDASPERPKAKRRRTNKRGSFQMQEDALTSLQSSRPQSQAPTPKPRMLEPEEDILTDSDLPQLYQDDWSPDPEDFEGYGFNRPQGLYRPMTAIETLLKPLSKHDSSVRPLETLKRLAENTQHQLDQMQREYLYLDKITAPHARIPRKPVRGGRQPVEDAIFEDKKEADLYDYTFDARRIGFQDPVAQRIQRDSDGRELRHRRQRNPQGNNGTLPGWNFGEDEPLGPKRAVKPVNRFDGIVDQPRRRGGGNGTGGRTSKAPSMTPDRTTTPLGGPIRDGYGYVAATSGRWRGHVPKRILQLRGDSAGAATLPATGNGVAQGQPEVSPNSTRKVRPMGSRNVHRRRDAGVKKGLRRARDGDDGESLGESEEEEV